MSTERLNELRKMGWTLQDVVKLLEELKQELEGTEKVSADERVLEVKVEDFLRNIGVPFNISGWKYMKTGLLYCLANEKCRDN